MRSTKSKKKKKRNQGENQREREERVVPEVVNTLWETLELGLRLPKSLIEIYSVGLNQSPSLSFRPFGSGLLVERF